MLTPRKVNSMPKAQNASEERRIEEFQSEKQRNQENDSRKIKLKESHNMELEEHEKSSYNNPEREFSKHVAENGPKDQFDETAKI